MSRDPLNERGRLNVYGFFNNNPFSFIDIMRLAYGERLTQSEAEELDCAIQHVIGPAITFHLALKAAGSSAAMTLTLATLKRFIDEKDEIAHLTWSDMAIAGSNHVLVE